MKNQQRREETRAAILSAAITCFASHGYQATGVAKICRRAGVSKGAFYYHFESKQAVFLEVLNSWLMDLERSLAAVVVGERSIPDSLLKMARMLKTVFESDPGRITIFLEFWTQASRDAHVRQAISATYSNYLTFFTDLIQRGIDEGSCKPMDPAVSAQALLSLASGMFIQGVFDPEGADWGQIAEDSIRVLLEGIKRRSS